MTGSHKLLNLF